MQEHQWIETFAAVLGTSPYQADAEIRQDSDGFALYSMDSFSEREDFLANLPPRQIGRNMAYAACADILACGAVPESLLQCWSCDDSHGLSFYKEVSEGVRDVLSHYGACCLGGDLGSATEWIWTATVIAHTGRPVTRVASERVDFDMYVSGPLGEANAAVFRRQSLSAFPWRSPVPKNAILATDTSGGLFDALENFRRVNHGLRMELDAEAVISPSVHNMLPASAEPGWTLVGGVGEYELLFALPAGSPCREGVKIGSGYFCKEFGDNDIRLLYHGKWGTMKAAPPDYRAIPKADWLSVTARYWASLFN
jgi:thiamine monophosphate kinase